MSSVVQEKKVRVRCCIIDSEGQQCTTMTYPGPKCGKCRDSLGHQPCSRCTDGWASIANCKRLGKTTCRVCTHELAELAVSRPNHVDRLIRQSKSANLADYKDFETEDGDMLVTAPILHQAVCARLAIDRALELTDKNRAGGLTSVELSEILAQYVAPPNVRRDRSRSRGRRPTVRTRSCGLKPKVVVKAPAYEELKSPDERKYSPDAPGAPQEAEALIEKEADRSEPAAEDPLHGFEVALASVSVSD